MDLRGRRWLPVKRVWIRVEEYGSGCYHNGNIFQDQPASSKMSDYRIERDSMGDVRVPAQAYYGAQTQRAVENFPISGQPLPTELIHAIGLVKFACGVANRDLGKLTRSGKNPLNDKQVQAMLEACREVAAGNFDD